MRILNSVVLGVLGVLIATSALSQLQAQVDRNPIAKGQTVTLIVTYEGRLAINPDWQPLAQDFTVLATHRSTQLSLHNGQTAVKTQWLAQLMPKQEGVLTIPSLQVGTLRTDSIALEVQSAPTTAPLATPAAVDEQEFIETGVEPEQQVYVQQQVRYKVRLYRRQPVPGTLIPFQLNQGRVESLGNSVHYETTVRGLPFLVTEWQFALFPEQAGELTLTPPYYEESPNIYAFPGFLTSVPRRVAGQSYTIKVLPPPVSHSPWLPAKQVTLQQELTPSDSYQVGEPITWTITLTAVGVTAEQLPEIATPLPAGVNHYPDQPQTSTELINNDLQAMRRVAVALVPTQAGRLVLPPVHLTWWDTTTGQSETAHLPQQELTVAPSLSQPVALPLSPSTNQEEATPVSIQEVASPHWIWLGGLLLLGVGVLVGFLSHRRARQKIIVSPADKRQTSDLVSARRRLQDACANNQAALARSALLDYARTRWPNTPISGLTTLTGSHPNWQAQCEDLERALYGSADRRWQGALLWQAFLVSERDWDNLPTLSRKDSLPSLYGEGGE